MKLTFEMDPHNAKDVTTLSRISRALDWKDFPIDEEGDEEAPYPVDEAPLEVEEPEAPVAEPTSLDKLEAKYEENKENTKHLVEPPPEKPKRTRRSKAEIEAEKEAKAAGAPDPEPTKEEPKVEQPEPLGFGAPPPVDPKVLRNQLLDTMMALHKLYQAGNAAPINNVINEFKSRCTGGKFDSVNDVPDSLLPEVIAFADKQLRG